MKDRQTKEIKIVTDVHGAYDELARQLSGEDTLILLGDYVQLVDFKTLDGVLSQAFTREEVGQVLEWLVTGERAKAGQFIARFALPEGDRFQDVRRRVVSAYRQLYERIPCQSYLLYGNTDYPDLMREALNGCDRLRIMDGEVLEIEGVKIGFVSGSPPMPWTFNLPGVRLEKVFNAKIEALGKVDILCSHVPPQISDLAFDVVARKDEGGSLRLLEYIRDCQPSWVYYGHVHNPLKASLTLGKSQLVNLACFRLHQQVYSHPLS